MVFSSLNTVNPVSVTSTAGPTCTQPCLRDLQLTSISTPPTYPCMHGKVEIIANGQGKLNYCQSSPSLILSNLIGNATKNQVAMNLTNTVFDNKRLILRRSENTVVQSDMKHW